MNTKTSLIVVLVASLLLSACATVPSVTVSVAEPDRIRFQGKGAGAGMMLMSSMGAMGIAIGVAIDEGIGKDIDAAARTEGFNIQAIIEAAAKTHLFTSDITVERYGFVTRPGDNDPVAVQLHLNIVSKDGQQQAVKYPEDFEKARVSTFPLDDIKLDGKLTITAFEKAISSIFAD